MKKTESAERVVYSLALTANEAEEIAIASYANGLADFKFAQLGFSPPFTIEPGHVRLVLSALVKLAQDKMA